MYSKDHVTQVIKVILGKALDHLGIAADKLNIVEAELSGPVINYLKIESELEEAAVEISHAYFRCGGPESVDIAEIFEPLLANINSALLMFQGCFHKWADGREPPGLTPHACMSICQEITAASAKITQAHDVVFDKVNGLVDALREIETIRIITES